jgi:polyhydroxyalkanoate synthesis regulator phasin
MPNMKIISIMDAENRAQSDAIAQDLRTALEVVEDEINVVRDRLQQQIDELKQRVTTLEGNTP